MIVKWNEDRMKVVPTSSKLCVLYPGANDMSADEFKEVEPHIQLDIKLGRIEVITTKGAEGKAKRAEFKDLSLEEAKKVLKTTVNLESVRAWLDTETRPDVRVAIERRVSSLEKEIEKSGPVAAGKGLE